MPKRSSNPTVYKYEIDEKTGKYVLTSKTNMISLYWIERILGVVQVKGAKVPYELIEIKNRHYDVDGLYLVKRKHINRDIIESFVSSCSYCTRSVQHRPYTDDLKDPDLLSDIGAMVFTYKHWACGDKVLYDEYIAIKKENITTEFLEKLDEMSKAAIEASKTAQERDKSALKVLWEEV